MRATLVARRRRRGEAAIGWRGLRRRFSQTHSVDFAARTLRRHPRPPPRLLS